MSEVAVALDFPDRKPALALVERLGDEASLYKVGLELFTREGPGIIRELRRRRRRVFLDLKLHDIPATVAGAVSASVEEEVELLTVHASGGEAMLRAAAEAAAGRLGLLGVTVLTSLSKEALASTWGRSSLSVREEVLRLGGGAVEAGLDGLVASAQEAASLRSSLGSEVTLVTPGIRLAGEDHHDQARVTTPGDAVRMGSDVLVVGRAVTAAPDPREALSRIRKEMADAAVGEPTGAEA